MYGETYQNIITVVSYVLVTLANLPIVCLVGFVIKKSHQLIKVKKIKTNNTVKPTNDELVLKTLDDRDHEESSDYLSFYS